MKKVLLSVLILGAMVSTASASMSYECWAYKGGSPWKMVHVTANSKSEAESKAWDKFKNVIGISPESVKCK